MKIAILRDHNPESSAKWELACRKKNIEYLPVNMLRNDWLQIIQDFSPDFCVSRPPGDIQKNKSVFDEKLFFLENHLSYTVFPCFLATYIYENKSSLAWFLAANEIPHPNTFVSSDKKEALNFIKDAPYPVIAKTLIGAAGSGIKILQSPNEANHYIQKAFSKGIKRRFGPNRRTGNPSGWLKKALNSPNYFFKKINQYKRRNQDVQKNTVLFQEYIPHNYEWRCVKIGESFFAYKKLKMGAMSSGSKQFEYGVPPPDLLDFTRNLCERFNFSFMAVDVFYNEGKIFVNELQTIFGHKNPYICMVNKKTGRYHYKNNKWLFEEGDFNTNESYDLRLETAIKLFHNSII